MHNDFRYFLSGNKRFFMLEIVIIEIEDKLISADKIIKNNIDLSLYFFI